MWQEAFTNPLTPEIIGKYSIPRQGFEAIMDKPSTQLDAGNLGNCTNLDSFPDLTNAISNTSYLKPQVFEAASANSITGSHSIAASSSLVAMSEQLIMSMKANKIMAETRDC